MRAWLPVAGLVLAGVLLVLLVAGVLHLAFVVTHRFPY